MKIHDLHEHLQETFFNHCVMWTSALLLHCLASHLPLSCMHNINIFPLNIFLKCSSDLIKTHYVDTV